MHFKIALFALVGTACAGSTLYKRDLQTILTAINNVNTAATTLDNDVKAYDGSAGAISKSNTDAASVLSAINTGTTNVRGTSAVSDSDALQIASATETLITTVNNTINDLITKKPTFDSSGQSPTVLNDLRQQDTASDALGDAIVSKVPSDVTGIAQSLTAEISASFQRGITAYGG